MKNTQKKSNVDNIKKNILFYSQSSNNDVLRNLNVDRKMGLSTRYVEDWQYRNGYNEINQENDESWYISFLKNFLNPFNFVLFASAIVDYYIDEDLPTAIQIVVLIIISAIIQFYQEEKSRKATKKLKLKISATSDVIRDGKEVEIPVKDIVKGDIITLTAGDIIPADLRIIESKNLFISQSSLTGESEPIEKFSDKLDNISNPLEANNIAFMGTNVTSGMGTGVVIDIATNTYFGSMAKLISKKKSQTNFDKGLNDISWFFIKFMIILVITIFFIKGFAAHDWKEGLSYAIISAIFLTPEMLPVIVSSNLAKGVVSMAKKKTIIKNTNSIQNFGSMDILCSDKTGTLTQNSIVLQYHLNNHGKEDYEVLKYAYLNSFFQTGLKNLLDLAIIEKSKEKNIGDYVNDYTKIDELPFDFERRRLSVLVEDNQQNTTLITKGALTEMLQICSFVKYNDEIVKINDKIKKEIEDRSLELNSDGMRVLGIAYKSNVDKNKHLQIGEENNMIFIGLLSFLDPPKQSAKSAIDVLNKYDIKIKVLTGDSEVIAKYICKSVGVKNHNDVLLGADIDEYTDEELKKIVEKVDIFAKLTPQQKTRIVKVLKSNNHTVGFIGDGINDAPAMREADVGISVDTAVDIAKDSADIILLRKDLNVLLDAVIEGRKIICNIIKFIKMTVKANFGAMFSILFAEIFLPFEPIQETQILIYDTLYGLFQISIPWDNVDEEYIINRVKWESKSIMKFMLTMGSIVPCFDLSLFFIMYKLFGWNNPDDPIKVALFQTGWYVEWYIAQIFDTFCLRTRLIPIIQSRPSKQVVIFSSILVAGALIPFTRFGSYFEFASLPFTWFCMMFLFYICYFLVHEIAIKIYVKYNKSLL